MFKTITVGRSDQSDVVIDHETISRAHLEITRTDQGRYYVIDRGSSWGTFVWRGEKWEEIKQGYMAADDQIALGKKKVAMSDLIVRAGSMLADGASESENFERVTVRPRRSAQTGEISE